jgi:Universal stress protein family
MKPHPNIFHCHIHQSRMLLPCSPLAPSGCGGASSAVCDAPSPVRFINRRRSRVDINPVVVFERREFGARAGRWSVRISAARAVLEAVGLSTSIHVREGDPLRVMLEEARAWGADCVFVGPRGRGGATWGAGLGRVAAGLVTGAHCSVEVAR